MQNLFGPVPNVPYPQQQQQQQQPQQQPPWGQQQQQQPVTIFRSAAPAPPAQQAAFGPTQSFGLFGGTAVSAPGLAPQEVPVNADDLPEDEDDFEDLEGPGAISEPTTVVSETPMAISFSVHGESTIPSDGVEHQASVAVLPFQAKVSYISIPRIDPRVFLQVNLDFSSKFQ
jgi:hypothetical protein